jgi:hypothetical protein
MSAEERSVHGAMGNLEQKWRSGWNDQPTFEYWKVQKVL